MKVFKRSILSGEGHWRDIPADPGKIAQWLAGVVHEHIQNYFPELSAEDREFLLNGITPEEWETMLPPENEDDNT